MELTINIEDNPHVLLGQGLWAISVGDMDATMRDGSQAHLGFVAFHPVINQIPLDRLDETVSVDNVADLANPPVSLVFSSVESAERLMVEIQKVIGLLKETKND